MNHPKSSASRIRQNVAKTTALLRSVPTAALVLFVLTVISMNFLSRITLVSLPWLALNSGISVSWLSFLFMDVVTRHFGARAANKLSIVAIAANLGCCLACFLISRIGRYPALDMILGGQWSILTASTIAYVISALSNNYTNVFVGRLLENPDGKLSFVIRSYVSTLLSQILDNFIFVFLAFVVFPNIPGALPVHWTVRQCIGCSLACAVLELLSEVVFSPLGYSVAKKWKEKGVGQAYIEEYCPDGVLHA